MSVSTRQHKSWLLRAELVIFFCLACFCIIKDIVIKPDYAAAKVIKQVVKRNPVYPDKSTLRRNIITSILYSQDNPSIILDDERIAQEADVVEGVKIVKIYPDKVEFEKEGQHWMQKIGERLKNTEQSQIDQGQIYWDSPGTDG